MIGRRGLGICCIALGPSTAGCADEASDEPSSMLERSAAR